MELDIKKMSSRELHLATYKANVRLINANNAIRAAGRGDERPSEVRAKSDSLSREYVQAEKACLDIIAERDRRKAHHGNLRPIKEIA